MLLHVYEESTAEIYFRKSTRFDEFNRPVYRVANGTSIVTDPGIMTGPLTVKDDLIFL